MAEPAAPRAGGLLLVLFVLLAPLIIWVVAELALLIWVGAQFGLVKTILLVGASFVLGAGLAVRAGRKAVGRVRDAVAAGEPMLTQSDAGMLLTGALLLIVPGFLSDLVGLLFVLPFTRPMVRRVLSRVSSWAERKQADPAQVVVPGEVVTNDGTAEKADGPLILEGTIVELEEEERS